MKSSKPRRPVSITVMYAASAIIALIAVAFLINNVILFFDTVAQYVAQGYSREDVLTGLTPGQLIPGVVEPVAVYGGIALIIFGLAQINHKLANGLGGIDATAAQEDAAEETADDAVLEDDPDDFSGFIDTSNPASDEAQPETDEKVTADDADCARDDERSHQPPEN